jgi:hypothetical protein
MMVVLNLHLPKKTDWVERKNTSQFDFVFFNRFWCFMGYLIGFFICFFFYIKMLIRYFRVKMGEKIQIF